MNASAQFESIERLVMPGPVVANHAEFEAQCGSCHVRFARQQQRDLCLACHKEIADDLREGRGFHGLSLEVGDVACASCHTDHEGRGADISGLDVARFDHALTDFPLRASHVDIVCEDCHVANAAFHEADTACVACHRDDDRHRGNLGEVCADCHTETVWSDVRYDHELESGFPLTGAHAELACGDCHVDERYVDTPAECVGCHRADDLHMGNNGTQCRDCHGTADWAVSLFDHFARSGFALAEGHSGLSCESCHVGNKLEQRTPTECFGCHLDDDAHAGINGTECVSCHRVTSWLDVTFDHLRDTRFALNGAHAKVDCTDCHVEAVAASLPPTQCIGCHRDDDPHAAQLGEDCGSCHAGLGWTDGVRFDHDLSRFPLLGRHDDAACEDCHASPAFHDATELCVDCHLEDDAHAARLGADCALCHTPIDWLVWRFEHDVQTDFALDGAHAGLDCQACHREAAPDGVLPLTGTCVSCHRRDDVHRGDFGDDCAACHVTEAFGVLRTQ